MDFNFLSLYNFNTYPEVSPLLPNNFHQTDPFYFQGDEEEESFLESTPPQLQNAEKENQIISPEPPEIKKEKENLEESLNLDISPRILEIFQSNLFDEQEKEIEIGECKLQNLKMTNPTTDKTKIGNIGITKKEIFGLKTQKKIEILPRIDYAIKNFKVTAVKFIKDYANKLIRDCKFKDELKNSKLFAPSNKYFTGVSNEKENKVFLDFTVAEIFFYPNLEFGKDIRLQQNNKKTINQINQKINDTKEIPKAFQELKNFLDMSFADAIIFFYKSDEFLKFKRDERTQFLDSQFVKVKGFSLLEPNAFLELMKHSSNKI